MKQAIEKYKGKEEKFTQYITTLVSCTVEAEITSKQVTKQAQKSVQRARDVKIILKNHEKELHKLGSECSSYLDKYCRITMPIRGDYEHFQ